ncbi:MAG: SUMF1/EgtB/PvdO family nonheme iron enzyme [Pseudomonadales bacterium]
MTEQHDHNETLEATRFEAPSLARQQNKSVISRSTIIVSATLVIMMVMAWHLFTARAISLVFIPSATTQSVSGWLTLQLGERYLVRPGSITVEATREGYYPFNQTLQITELAEQAFELPLKKLPGNLDVDTAGVEALVFLDGAPRGTSPLSLTGVSAGTHQLRIEAERYLPYEASIDIEGLGKTQTFVHELEPRWAEVDLSSNPDQAQLIVDGEARGLLPQTAELLEGTRRLMISKSGYQSQSLRLNLARGESVTIPTFELKPANGLVQLQSKPPGAVVRANGEYIGETPLDHALSPGTSYSFEVSKSGYETHTETLSLEPTEVRKLSLTLDPRLGRVTLAVTPADAELRINGILQPQRKRVLDLPSRPQTLLISKSGYASLSKVITPQPDFEQSLSITLLTEAEFALAQIPEIIETSIDYRLQRILPSDVELGAPRRDRGGRGNEVQRTVRLSSPYYLGITEITNAQYAAFNANHNPGVLGRTRLTSANRPVVGISWKEAVAFCNWLSDRERIPRAYEISGDSFRLITPRTQGYRLPTEAEWVRAGRYADAGAPSRFPWGDALPPPKSFANLADDTAMGLAPNIIAEYSDGFRGPAPVGHFRANALGIFDLSGNVSEWTHDRFSTARSTSVAVDWAGPETGEVFVIRGSSFLTGTFSALRWAYRDSGREGRQDLGFRLAKDAPNGE